ncbi:MAG: glycosyltransferase [Clostridia bacterium]|nr:glycosyltransferase [Clostridia bacterium]
MTKTRKKLLYVASTASHLKRFHMPYIEALRADADVMLMGTGDPEFLDFDLPFEKNMLSAANFGAIRRIRRILKKEKFDAVILNTSLAAFLVRAAMIGMRHRPFVHNIVHGYLYNEPTEGKKEKILALCERVMRKKTDMISVMNAADLEIAGKGNLCLGEVAFIYGMGVNMPAELPAVDADLRAQYAGDGEVLCTFVGELSGRKNQTFLIDAIKKLRDGGAPVRLMLLGEGAERESLEAQIRENGLEGAVYLLGNREPVLPYLAVTDIYVSASKIEGLPFNVMEAMACGLPILASNAKGQTDLLADKPESLYQIGDLDAFCETLAVLAASDRLGVGAVSYPMLDRYRLDAVMEENLKLMKKGWC